MTKRFAFVVSTSGAVMNQVLSSEFLRKRTHAVFADVDCSAVEKARCFGIESQVIKSDSNENFCLKLADRLHRLRIDYVISFYTQFYSDDFRRQYEDRIINFHPSLLPAFKGMDGFGDGITYHTKIIGTTVELIKDVMDEGKIVMQTACTVDPNLSLAQQRHLIFVQQCKTLIQVVKWLDDDRVRVSGDLVQITGAKYTDLEFVPALEFDEALSISVPHPLSNANPTK